MPWLQKKLAVLRVRVRAVLLRVWLALLLQLGLLLRWLLWLRYLNPITATTTPAQPRQPDNIQKGCLV
ncbi:hypothetical protein B224_3306 [Aeromonas media WS]|nr:hypothetical protein B224_3306 [Aeromonas media WS]